MEANGWISGIKYQRGCACAQFSKKEDALNAIEGLNNFKIQSSILTVELTSPIVASNFKLDKVPKKV